MTKEIGYINLPKEDKVEYKIHMKVPGVLSIVVPSPEAYDKLKTKVAYLEDRVACLTIKIQQLEKDEVNDKK